MGAFAERRVFDRIGGRLSLDFTNTMSGLRGRNPEERLFEYADLVWWGQQAGLLDQRRAQQLLEEAERHPRRAAQAFETAIAAREALHDVVLAGLQGRVPDAPALEALNSWIADALRHRRLRPAGPGAFQPDFPDDGDLLAFLRPVAADAALLLEHDLPTGRVRICEMSVEENCGWLFLDETRNHSRRWCDMSDCGNRAKAKRHYRRVKAARKG
jgi:predicted RNA-binding Zn ribbon-like protein